MYLAYGARALAAVALAAATLGVAAASTDGTVTAPAVTITPGVQHQQREAHGGPSTTAECEQSIQIACYNPAQLQRAYHLPALYSRGITGKGATIVVIDPYGSPTIGSDLRTFNRAEGVPSPPSLRIIRPAGKVPAFSQNNANMVGWASETTLDVEYAHTIAPGAKILLVETPGGGRTGTVSMDQIVTAEKYVIRHHLGSVISQSFVATEQAISSAAIRSLRGVYQAASAGHVTVLAGSGDSGATGFGSNQQSYYTHPVTAWPASDPLVTAVGGTRLDLDASGNRNSADTVWNDTYSRTANQLVNGDNGPNPLAGGGGKSVVFGRPSYQNGVRGVVGSHRGVPDISMSAACTGTVNVYQSFGGQRRLVRAVRHQRGHAAVRRDRGARRPGGRPPARPDQPGAVQDGLRALPGHRERAVGEHHGVVPPGWPFAHGPRLRRQGRIQPGGRPGHGECSVLRPGAGPPGGPLKRAQTGG